MPAAIVVGLEMLGAALLGAGAGAIGAGIMLYAAEIATALVLAGGLAYSSSQKSKAERQARAQYNAAQVDRLVNVATTTAPRELVLGRVRKGGSVFFRGTTDVNNTKFVLCIALASHEIDAVETIYFNDVEVVLDGSGYVTSEPYTYTRTESASEPLAYGSASVVLAHVPISTSIKVVRVTNYDAGGEIGAAVSGANTEVVPHTLAGSTVTVGDTLGGTVSYQYQDAPSKARVRWYLGTASQTADARLITLFPALWTSAHRARGVAYLICEFDYDETAYPSGLPNVTAVIRGAKLYDPRTTTTGWSENPALMARHLLTHPQFGKRASITAAEDARITAAANACDAATVYTVAGVAQASRALYQAALVLPFGATARDALDDITQAMAGQWAYASGAFYLRAGAYSASVLTLGDSDLAVVQRGADGATSQSPIQITTHRARDQQFNIVTPTIWDASQDYKQTALTPLKAATLITRDGVELVRDVSMPAVGYAPQALHIAGVMLRDARDPLSVVLPFKLSAYRVELFDTISLTLARYGWSTKTFIVLGREWTGDGSIKLTLKENTASTYSLDGDFLAQGGAANTALPVPWDVPDVAGLVVTSGQAEAVQQPDGAFVTTMRVTWSAFTDLTITQGGAVEVQWRAATSTGDWSSATANGAETSVVAAGLTAGVHYVVRARARSAIAVGLWCAEVLHQAWGVGIEVAVYRENLAGWPGKITNGEVVGGTVLEAASTSSQQWGGKSAWSAFTSWRTAYYTTLSYETLIQDLGSVLALSVKAWADASGAVTSLRIRGSDVSSAAVLAQPWADVGATLIARWVQVGITVVATTEAPIPALRTFEVSYRAGVMRQAIRDMAIASLTGANRITVGDVVLPTYRAYQRITFVSVTILDPRQGIWSWSFLGRDAARIQIRLDGALTDPASIDATIEGY